jgi:hypothetical protein
MHPEMEESSVYMLALNPETNLPLALAMRFDNPYLLLLNNNNNADLPEKYLTYRYFRDHSEWESSKGNTHVALGLTTLAAYTTTAILGVTMPDDGVLNEKGEGGKVDSVFLHKSLALVHLAAIASLPILGHSLEEKGPQQGRVKQNVAWAGFVTLSIAAVTVSF